MWKEPSASSGLVEGQDFPITQAFVHLARSDHVALIEVSWGSIGYYGH